MGRLFWKFFLIVWLVQLAGAVATGTVFWLEHRRRDAFTGEPPPPEQFRRRLAPDDFGRPPPPGDGWRRAEPPPGPPGAPPQAPPGPLPPLPHIVIGLLASLLSAAAIAGYVARPVRRLKKAFAAAGDGDLATRIGSSMGRRKDELADLGRDFDRMADRLQHQIEAQKRLLHDVSHELRSPLARLHAAIGLARQQPERFEETMTRLEREGQRMDQLVGELLTLARIDAGETGAAQTVDLGELLAELVEDARFEASQRGIGVELAAPQALPVRADPALLHRALENIVRNALRHSPTNGTVSIETSSPAAGRCRIAILDRGPGVAEERLEEIFMPFRRASEGGGYGLGLAIARRIVEAAGGTITAANRAGGGFCVVVELPLGLPCS